MKVSDWEAEIYISKTFEASNGVEMVAHARAIRGPSGGYRIICDLLIGGHLVTHVGPFAIAELRLKPSHDTGLSRLLFALGIKSAEERSVFFAEILSLMLKAYGDRVEDDELLSKCS